MNANLTSLLAAFTLVVLFGFPKAGVYVGNIPITLSYILLGAVATIEVVRLAMTRKRTVDQRYLWLGALLFALATIEIFAFRVYGSQSLGAMVSILVSTIVMPIVTILATHWMLRMLGIDGVLSALRCALVIVFVIGMAAFVTYNTTGRVIGIPFVTTTGGDISLVATRHNLRGPVIKMISTYNNGNILGISLLMWGPIAALATTRYAVGYRALCVLTLSRSVWAGLIVLEVLGALVNRSLKRVGRAFFGALFLIVAVVIASLLIGKDPMAFLLDKDLGGRLTNLQHDLEVISTQRIGWESESMYAAAVLAFGPIGLAMLLAIWMLPIVSGGDTEVQRVSRIVLLVYLLVASVEGAFTLVPTQAVYWFVAAIAMSSPELVTTRVEAEEAVKVPSRTSPPHAGRLKTAAASRLRPQPSRVGETAR